LCPSFLTFFHPQLHQSCPSLRRKMAGRGEITLMVEA
jgi:hypothetical protein